MQYFIVRVANFEPFFSQAFFGKNIKFLCLLDWKFPEFFKTYPTHPFKTPRPVMVILTLITLFWDTLYVCKIVLDPINCRSC